MMKHKFLVLVVILLSSWKIVISQPTESVSDTGKSFGVAIGFAEFEVRDEVLNGMMHRNIAFPGKLFYNIRGIRYIHKVEFEFLYSRLKSAY